MKPEDNDSHDEPEIESTAMDGVIREYARTGSSADDEQLLSEIRQSLDEVEKNETSSSEGETPPESAWILGSSFWKTVGAIAAVLVLFLGIQSVVVYSEVADPTEIQVFTQPRFTPGTAAHVRAQVRNGDSLDPVANAQVETVLVSERDQRIPFETAYTDENGFVLVSTDIPGDLEEGDYTLEIRAKGESGNATLSQSQPVSRSFRTMLSSDKPLYQPGQIIHLRALSLNHDSMRPASGRPVYFEIRDPKGNKVFGKRMDTSDFGIASADFQLANQVNEGEYKIVATVGDTTSERTVKVERYTLPKYKISLGTDRAYYEPGEMVELTIDCQYTFGKPVSKGEVKIVAQEYVEQFRTFKTLSGTTDENGRLTFQLPLKEAFVGQPLNKGAAFVRFVAEVTDPANETRTASHEVKVTNSPIQIEVFPESGELVQNVENRVYILTAYPDGTPAKTTVTFSNDESKTVETSAMGIASVQLTPNSPNLKLTLEARDENGTVSKATKPLRVGGRNDGILLRTDRAVYRHGQTLNLDVFSATRARRVFLDVVKNGRSALSKSISLENGSGKLAIDFPADLVGTLQLQAYSILDDGEMVRDTKVIQVNRNDELTVTAQLDKETYKPAEKAIIEFLVSGKDGNPVEAALSLSAVDEAVFALNDMRPGLEEMYFLVQEEILKPRYQLVAQPQIGPLTDVPTEEPELIEADVIVFSGAEGTNAAPDITKSPTFEERSNDVRENQSEHSDFLRGLVPWIPTSLAGMMFLGLCGFTVQRFRQESVIPGPSPSNPDMVQFRSRIRWVFWSFLGAIFLPPSIIMLGAGIGVIDSGDVALFFLIVLAIGGLAALIVATILAGKSEVARRHPVMRRSLKALPWIFVLTVLSYFVIAWATDYSDSWREEKTLFTVLAVLGGLILVVSGIPGWWRPEAAKSKVGLGVLMWLGRGVAIGFVPITVPVVFLFVGGFGMAPKAARNAMEGADWVMTADAFAMDGEGMPNSPNEGFLEAKLSLSEAGEEAPRVRKFFPETLTWQPQLVTDSGGEATLELDLADSITTWRLSGSAVSSAGQLGSFQEGIRVFQDFFVDIDFPVELTQNDEVAVPIAIFNYLDRPQTIEIDIKQAPWFEFTGDFEGVQTVTVPANSVSNATCQLRALRPGTGKLTVFANGDQLTDAVERPVTVRPDGDRIEVVMNGRLDAGKVSETLTIPEYAIDGGSDLYLKVYPGAFSQVVEGMDSIFRMPHGCFEQTSSTTYPNILTLNYMRETGEVAPDIEMKALNFINIGYQRLISYEVPGGGFDWFGNPPAHIVLSAYGLMEFVDMAKVYEIDPDIITRTRDWLLSKRKNDGTWEPPEGGIAEGAINNFQGEQTMRTTAYIAWAIAQAGGEGSLAATFDYLKANHSKTEDPYTLALCAHVFHAVGEKAAAKTLLSRLDEIAKTNEEGKFAWWEASGESLTFGRGNSFSIETTAIVAQVFLAANHDIGTAHKALSWLIDQKDPNGTWHSTQATVQAMRALLAGAASNGSSVGEDNFELTFRVNDEEAGSLTISDENDDVYHLVSLTEQVEEGQNRVEIAVDQEANFAYQIVSVHYEPREIEKLEPESRELLTIETDYSTTNLTRNDILDVSVTLAYQRPEIAPMTLVDFGIPPGFEIVPESFQALVEKEVIRRFTAHGRQVTLYFDFLPGDGKPTEFSYQLRAKFPVKAQAPGLIAYQYYEPEIRDQSSPVLLTVE